uniref:Uncharacterized protein n=1 Tax=Molossus molossus TaxID=27622 RepID=A0A7J8FYS1_MOLMO|nr:hypothetical protein HJG59_008147 [Molossus molossus]
MAVQAPLLASAVPWEPREPTEEAPRDLRANGATARAPRDAKTWQLRGPAPARGPAATLGPERPLAARRATLRTSSRPACVSAEEREQPLADFLPPRERGLSANQRAPEPSFRPPVGFKGVAFNLSQ